MQPTDDHAQFLATELAEVRARLRRTDTVPDDGGAKGELLDAAQVSEQRERSGLTAERLAARARRLLAALDRLERGDYGRCTLCGEPIAPARLRALPGVDTCLRCQARRELEHDATP
jgi:DnaK suppressor protein